MWLENTVMYPTLHSTLRDILISDESTICQFILEPLAFPQLADCVKIHGEGFIKKLSYLTRTFAFYLHREYLKIKNSPQTNPAITAMQVIDFSNNSSVSVLQSSRTATAAACLRARAGYDQPAMFISTVSEVEPCREGPSPVKPVTASSLSSIVCHTNRTNTAVASTSLSGVTATNIVQNEVPSTLCQYQGCTVGFCGRLGSHDHATQASS